MRSQAQNSRKDRARKNLSATDLRNLRTLLLSNVLEPEEIGERIRLARERAGLRQEDLAQLINVSTRTVQYLEAGGSKPYGHLKAIAGATGETVEWFLHGDRPEQPEDSEVAARLSGLERGQEEVLRALDEIRRRLRDDPAEGGSP